MRIDAKVQHRRMPSTAHEVCPGDADDVAITSSTSVWESQMRTAHPHDGMVYFAGAAFTRGASCRTVWLLGDYT